jgi:hypothetical protein
MHQSLLAKKFGKRTSFYTNMFAADNEYRACTTYTDNYTTARDSNSNHHTTDDGQSHYALLLHHNGPSCRPF